MGRRVLLPDLIEPKKEPDPAAGSKPDLRAVDEVAQRPVETATEPSEPKIDRAGAAVAKTTTARTATKKSRRKKPASPDEGVEGLPTYLALQRKEVRMRDEQLAALTGTSRRLNKQRRGRGERITENTLVRVAIDLLLEQEASLAGATEAELRESLGLR